SRSNRPSTSYRISDSRTNSRKTWEDGTPSGCFHDSKSEYLSEGKMKRAGIVYVAIVPLFILSAITAWGQATAQISGTVRDQSSAVLPGVEITATQTETRAARKTLTNETGTYVLSNLPLGPYKLEAALAGFRTFVQSGIVLQVNSAPVINPVMEVGQVS